MLLSNLNIFSEGKTMPKKRKGQTYIYDSDSNVEPFQTGECKIEFDERQQMLEGNIDNTHCDFCLRKVWYCEKEECINRYKAMVKFEKMQLKKWKGRPRKKKRKVNDKRKRQENPDKKSKGRSKKHTDKDHPAHNLTDRQSLRLKETKLVAGMRGRGCGDDYLSY